MESLRLTYKTLLRERVSTIRRELIYQIDPAQRLIAIKGTRGVGKTNFLLDFARQHYLDDDSALYVNVNNLFLSDEGLYHFIKRFYQLGGKVLLLDQIHKYPNWDIEIRQAYDDFQELKIVFTSSSIVRIKSNENLRGVVSMYNLRGLSFREFLELETGYSFKKYTLDEIIRDHEEIAKDITQKVRPLAHFSAYLQYGYYPIYLAEKSHIDYLLKNINLTLEFDIPYNNQIELAYLPKLRRLLYLVATDEGNNINISKLSTEIGVSRATVLNYLRHMKDARLLTLLYDSRSDHDTGKKPNKLFVHNANLLHAVCLDQVDDHKIRQTFFISQLAPEHQVHTSKKADFLIDDQYEVNVCRSCSSRCSKNAFCFEDMIERGEDKKIPLWLIGFTY